VRTKADGTRPPSPNIVDESYIMLKSKKDLEDLKKITPSTLVTKSVA
jgi:hypothetical protein